MKKINRNSFIVLSIAITLLASFSLSYIFSLFSDKPTHPEMIFEDSAIKLFFLIVLIGPLFETLFLQAAVIEFIMYHLKVKIMIIPIIISGLFFGLPHFFSNNNATYMIAAILMGFVFASIYVLARKRKDINPFLITFICHFATNFIYFFTEMPN